MKKQTKPNPTSTRSRKYLSREQATSILDFLNREELPEHDSPFKLYFNGKLIGSANPPNIVDNDNNNKTNQNGSENNTIL